MSVTTAVIVAAGKGTRMGPNIDKLFLEVAGQPVIAHTWKIFDSSPDIDEIVLVIREPLRADFERLRTSLALKKPVRFADGGAERQNSVWNGVTIVSPETEIVAIQDGARPCTTHAIIRDCVEAARAIGASVTAQKVTDTLKEADARGLIARNVDRSKFWAVQTPQAFQVGVIRKALRELFDRGLSVTDDTAACELIGQAVKLVESKTPNPKVTTQADLPLVELLLREQRKKGDLH